MNSLSKTLGFSYKDLGKEGCLVFAFDMKGNSKYHDYFPIVWRVANLPARGIGRFSVTFDKEFVFATCQLEEDVVVPSSWEKAMVDGKSMRGKNTTPVIQNMALCSGKPSIAVPEPLFYFKDIGSQATIKVEFSGRLQIHSVQSLHQGMILKHDFPILWEQIIDEPGLAEEWIITYNNLTGNYEIMEAE